MKFTNYRLLPLLMYGLLFFSCTKEKRDILILPPNDILFEDLSLDRFSFSIPNAPFKSGNAKSGVVTMNVKKNNDGTFSGFAVSNKNWRSYPWNLSADFAPNSLSPAQRQASIDSCIFSVYTAQPNQTNNFLVANTTGGNAFITLDKSSVVEHILVANTTYNYLLENYGSRYSGTLDAVSQAYSLTGTKVRNIMNPNTSTSMYGRFYLPGPDGNDVIRLAGDEILAKRAAGNAAYDAAILAGKTETQAKADSTAAAAKLSKGYVKLTITGSKGGVNNGTVNFFLALRPNVDPSKPAYNFIAPDWFKVDLNSLGEVDKISFDLSSSYTDANGKMLVAPYFCLDGIRLKR